MLLQIFLILILFIVLTSQLKENFSVTGNVVIDGKKSIDETLPKQELLAQEDKKCLEHQVELDLLVGNQVISPLDADKILTNIKCKKTSVSDEGVLLI